MQTENGQISLAQEILSMQPLPIDAEAQLDALYVKASDIEKEMFSEIYEGLFTLQNL